MQTNFNGCVLADIPDFGRVADCGLCGNIHFTIGTTTLLLTPPEYAKLVALVHTSVSPFTKWLEKTPLDSTHAGRTH